MPRNKDLKQLVRARMKKTGEAYTTARAQILRKPKSKTRSQNAAPAKPAAVRESVAPPVEYAALAGKNDETIRSRTGRTWDEWVRTLDSQRAFELPHGKIAALVNTDYNIDGWWAQTVTVGYERIKGLRARLQRMDGTYEASKSRTFAVPVARLFDAWANSRTRRRWLNEPDVKVRTATAPKSIRLGWNDGTIVVVGFCPRDHRRARLPCSTPSCLTERVRTATSSTGRNA
jgi:hypothetical protein